MLLQCNAIYIRATGWCQLGNENPSTLCVRLFTLALRLCELTLLLEHLDPIPQQRNAVIRILLRAFLLHQPIDDELPLLPLLIPALFLLRRHLPYFLPTYGVQPSFRFLPLQRARARALRQTNEFRHQLGLRSDRRAGVHLLWVSRGAVVLLLLLQVLHVALERIPLHCKLRVGRVSCCSCLVVTALAVLVHPVLVLLVLLVSSYCRRRLACRVREKVCRK